MVTFLEVTKAIDHESSSNQKSGKQMSLEERRKALQEEKLRKKKEMEALEAEEAALMEVAESGMLSQYCGFYCLIA